MPCITFHLNPARRRPTRPGGAFLCYADRQSANMPGGALPGPGQSEKRSPGAGPVCVRLPANPLNSVLVRKPPGLKFRKCGPGGRRGLRTPARKPTEFGSRTQTPGPEIQKMRPGRRLGLRTPARKPTEFGFRTQTPGPEIQKMRPGRRRGLRTPARKPTECSYMM